MSTVSERINEVCKELEGARTCIRIAQAKIRAVGREKHDPALVDIDFIATAIKHAAHARKRLDVASERLHELNAELTKDADVSFDDGLLLPPWLSCCDAHGMLGDALVALEHPSRAVYHDEELERASRARAATRLAHTSEAIAQALGGLYVFEQTLAMSGLEGGEEE